MKSFLTVPVTFITDHGYAAQTYIACRSLINKMRNDTKYEIILIENGLSVLDINNFKSLQNESVMVKVIHVDRKMIEEHKIEIDGRWPLATYFKFFIADILWEYDKVIYLDGDVLVCQDLAEIYRTNVEDVYLGAVRDRLYDVFAHEKRLKTGRYYFNTGFLLLNLKKLREENLSIKMVHLKKENPSYGLADQDTYNVACGKKVISLPMKYNFYPQYFTMVEPIEYYQNNCVCPYNSLQEMWKDVAIIHMIGLRPWNLNRKDIAWIGSKYEHFIEKAPIGYISETWFRLLRESPYKDDIKGLDYKTQKIRPDYIRKDSVVSHKKYGILSFKILYTPKEGKTLDIKIILLGVCIVHRIKQLDSIKEKSRLSICGIPVRESILDSNIVKKIKCANGMLQNTEL